MSGRDPDDKRQRQGDMVERRRSSASRSGLYRPALVAAIVGLLLSLAGAWAVGQWEERIAKVEFEGVAETQAVVMQNGMNEYVSRLGALRTLFESANEEITRSEFETFSGRLFEQHPGILRVGWIPRIRRKERAELEAAAIGDGISGYHIKSLVADGSVATAPQSDQYLPVFFPPNRRPLLFMGWTIRPTRRGGPLWSARGRSILRYATPVLPVAIGPPNPSPL
jgi:CHASE1-domain containing sensor protein